MNDKVAEKQGRRCGVDRRSFLYAVHFPERRSGRDRREVSGLTDPEASGSVECTAGDRKGGEESCLVADAP